MKFYWSVDMFEPSYVGARYTRTMRFSAGSPHDSGQAVAKLARLFRGNESEASNLTAPGEPHVAWPDRVGDGDQIAMGATVLYRNHR
jgi:hypothetical protein